MANENKTSFGKIMIASGVGFLIVNAIMGIFFMIFLGIMVAATSGAGGLNEKSVLVINLNKEIVEQQPDDFNINLDFLGISASKIGLNRILETIKDAKDNENIKGIYLDLNIVMASMSEIEEIRLALVDFKKSGKFIIAHANNYSHSSYYLATAADKIYMTPTGVFLWKGISSETMFFKGLLQKIDIEPIVIRHGKFKAAVEPFILDSMSNENKLQVYTMISNYWKDYLGEISRARNLKIDDMNMYADKLLVNSSQKAVDYGFIDALKFKQDVIDEIKEIISIEKKKKLSAVSVDQYYEKAMKDKDLSDNKKDKIAIIYAEGQIVEGKSTDGNMGSETIAKAIHDAAMDEDVKAIVLRVNSPGGSALASEIMLNEIIKAKKLKPIVVSMGKYAASGGYYISCMADYIYAEKYTLTGSIGVFGLLFNIEKLLKNKLGINIQVVKTNSNADFGNLTRKMSKDEELFFQAQIEEIYDIFITHVSEGRSISKEQVDSIGQGRIWTSSDALRLKLIDEIGTIDLAINKAAELAKISDYSIKEYPKVKAFWEEITEKYTEDAKIKKFGQLYDTYKQIEKLSYLNGAQMLMPFEIEIK